ncbi:UPF0262 family protein [Parvularcula sp. LCG005]|uniref:UPF0262 family protein n=1 Tax=Parvularcula sp. LCG005 TaxID=3078805 RepID=UPI002942391E|nr:UPF0262 family protein [Parvularcula sp. LCG005]WOI53785.1 UPF0262 family protein [Parvularcula sp. LCG005]
MADHRLVKIDIDDASLVSTSSIIDHERKVAMFDLLQGNEFAPVGIDHGGPYALTLSQRDGRLIFDIATEEGETLAAHHLSMSPMRRMIKDYFMLCESYYDTVSSAQPEKLETIDMARRAVHNEAAELTRSRLEGKIEVDFDTARRLFSLICSIAMRASHRGSH